VPLHQHLAGSAITFLNGVSPTKYHRVFPLAHRTYFTGSSYTDEHTLRGEDGGSLLGHASTSA
jgi:hypothetical protein